MSNPTANSPVRFEDYLGNPLKRGDIVAFTYEYGRMYTGVVYNARKTPKSYTLSIGYAMYNTITSTTTLSKTTLSDGAPKFCRVLIIPDSTPNLSKLYLDEAMRLRLDGQPLELPEKQLVKHTFDDFEHRWMKGLTKAVDTHIGKIHEFRKTATQNSYYGHIRATAFTTVFRATGFTTAFSEEKYRTTIETRLGVNNKVEFVVVRIRKQSARWSDFLDFKMIGGRHPYQFTQNGNGDFDGKKLIASDVEAKMKEIFNA